MGRKASEIVLTEHTTLRGRPKTHTITVGKDIVRAYIDGNVGKFSSPNAGEEGRIRQWIYDKRKEMGFSHRALAEVSGVPMHTVSRYEQIGLLDISDAPIAYIYRLAIALKVPMDFFLDPEVREQTKKEIEERIKNTDFTRTEKYLSTGAGKTKKALEAWEAGKGNQKFTKMRTACGFSQSMLAKISGQSIRAVQQYEQGKYSFTNCRLLTAYRFATALGVSMVDLLEYTDKEKIEIVGGIEVRRMYFEQMPSDYANYTDEEKETLIANIQKNGEKFIREIVYGYIDSE